MPRRKAASEADQQAPSATPGKADPKKDKAAAKREFLNSYVHITHNTILSVCSDLLILALRLVQHCFKMFTVSDF